MRDEEFANLKNLYLAQTKRYNKILNDELAGTVDNKKRPTPINKINYIFVTFQSPISVLEAQKIFVKEGGSSKLKRMRNWEPMTKEKIE